MEAVLGTVRGEPLELTVAGRTDAGVHALGQVASHAGEPLPLGAWNGNLPSDIRVLTSDEAADGFDARRGALSRAYAYRVYTRDPLSPFMRRRALHWPYRLDRAALDACAAFLPGKHDLTAFTRTQTAHRLFDRNIGYAEWVDAETHLLEFRIEAPSFMRNQVRILVGTMLEVAQGRRSMDDFQGLFEGRPRSAAGDTAPPHGLYLVRVRYDS
jgi:tRNA pseudouridine38-40 synthase